MVAAARRDHVERVIAPALSDGKIVICDRFIDSTFAYQGGADDVSDDQLETLEQLACEGVSVDLTLVLDAAPEDVLMRRSERGGPSDRFEDQDIEFHQNVRERFLQRSRTRPERIKVLDALAAPEALLKTAAGLVEDALSLSEKEH